MSSITGIVLAAGASERMGEPKLLLPFGDTTVLNATLAAVEASSVDQVVVVTGCNAGRIEESITTERATVVRNPDYRRGNMSSFLTGVDAVPESDVFVLVAGDLPAVRTEAIDAFVERWRSGQLWAAVARYRDRIAHPFLLSRAAVEHAREVLGDKVLWRALVDPGDERVVQVPLSFDAPVDVNTREDYGDLVGGE
ncbi:MAG: nucleotidyltransferase family protein [Actinomycetota bacterium]